MRPHCCLSDIQSDDVKGKGLVLCTYNDVKKKAEQASTIPRVRKRSYAKINVDASSERKLE
jgi:hypothetical protein